MRHALILSLLARATFPGAIEPSGGVRSFAVRTPKIAVHSGERLTAATLGGSFYATGGGVWPGEEGPVAVEGAEPGDTLIVTIESLRPKSGTAVSSPGDSSRPRRSVWQIRVDEGRAVLQDSVALPLRATLARLAVAPEGSLPVSDEMTGSFGGNLSMANVGPGTRVSLPVFHPGALFYFGDGRATPWEGPFGSGLLAPVEVTFRFDLFKGRAVDWPRIEDASFLAVQARARSFPESRRIAREALERWLVSEHGLTLEGARTLCSQGCQASSLPEEEGFVSLVRLSKSLLPSSFPKGIRLGEIPWVEAEGRLTSSAVVVLPLGAGSKEHGPHLLLRNDAILAEYFAERLLRARPVVVLPTLTYGFYPAFLDYPGSVSTSSGVQRDLVAEICRSIARHGPRRFYVLNTGISTSRPLKETATLLASEGILLRFSDLTKVGKAAESAVREEKYGTHADEIETSMLLYIDPSAVQMNRAVSDGGTDRPGPLTRDPNRKDGLYSPSGVFGDPTLASSVKGKIVVEGILSDMIAEIDALTADHPPSGEPRSPLETSR